MILIAVPFTAISVILHISDTFHYRPCNKYKIEIRITILFHHNAYHVSCQQVCEGGFCDFPDGMARDLDVCRPA